jgi:tetratricopeptide (TPR) repeat protein
MASLDAFADLLDSHELHEELVSLWEQQGAAAARAEEPSKAAKLWERAAHLAEERLHDAKRATADHERSAELGGMGSLETLARIYSESGDHAAAVRCLERICEQSRDEKLVESTLRLVDECEASGQWPLARTHLERVIAELGTSEVIVDRLALIYQHEEDWMALASMLAAQVARTTSPAVRLSYLVRAVELHSTTLHQPAAAIPLLEQLVELEPESAPRRLALADTLLEANRLDDAVRVLEAQLERYGARKPKERALVHFALARATSDRKRALLELGLASRIDSAHVGILHTLARVASEDGQLDLAEHTYHALLLLCRSSRAGSESLDRADILKELADIAERKNEPERAAEFRASATEAMSLRPAPVPESPSRTTDRPRSKAKAHGKRRSWPAGH